MEGAALKSFGGGEHEGVTSREAFSNMTLELTKYFNSWAEKSDEDIKKERKSLKEQSLRLQHEKEKLWKEHFNEKQIEQHNIKDEREKATAELEVQMKLIQTERHDAKMKSKLLKQQFEDEKERHRWRFNIEREKFRSEYQTNQTLKHKIVDVNIATETVVDLNVGGMIFETSRHTVVQQPGSFLEALLSGRITGERDRQGRIFIDRDSQHFRTILNFLRDPSVAPSPSDPVQSLALASDAEYYGIKFFPFPLVFACGGHNGVEHLKSIEILDIAHHSWRHGVSMLTERAYFGAGNILNRLFLFGGQNLEYKALCDTEVYDCLRNCWTSASSLNIPRRNLASATLDQRLFAIGGFDGSEIMAGVEWLDPRTKNWDHASPLTTPRSSAMACVQDGVLYVMGGTKGERLSTVEIYEPRMDKWQLFSNNMIEVRSGGAACAVGGKVYALGGADNSHAIHFATESLDIETERWTFNKPMSEPRMDCSSVIVSDSVMVAGGQNTKVSRTTEFFRPELNKWQFGPSLLIPRYGHALVLASI